MTHPISLNVAPMLPRISLSATLMIVVSTISSNAQHTAVMVIIVRRNPYSTNESCSISVQVHVYQYVLSRSHFLDESQVIVCLKIDPDRDSLNYFHKISGGIIGRQKRLGSAGCRRKGRDGALQCGVRKCVHFNGYSLSDLHVGKLGFLEVGHHPLFVKGNNGKERLTGVKKLTRLEIDFAYLTVNSGRYDRVGEVQPGCFHLGFPLFDSGFCHRRLATIYGFLPAYGVHLPYGSLLL